MTSPTPYATVGKLLRRMHSPVVTLLASTRKRLSVIKAPRVELSVQQYNDRHRTAWCKTDGQPNEGQFGCQDHVGTYQTTCDRHIVYI